MKGKTSLLNPSLLQFSWEQKKKSKDEIVFSAWLVFLLAQNGKLHPSQINLTYSTKSLEARYQHFSGGGGLTGISHGGDPSGSGAAFPGEEAEGFLVQTDPLGPGLPARELVDHCVPGPAALPGVWAGHGGSWDSHGYSASMGEKKCSKVCLCV